MSAPFWIIHLPTRLTTLNDATTLAIAIRESLGHLTTIDFGETTLSEEDRQFLRHRVWCDTPLDNSTRCHRPTEHHGQCTSTVDPADT
ncbi:hypothetical protein [Micromonospora craniellae]|uniref:Uncharacterized protein n=1 Tax=Micromonospora craniellae TaxID=2294034 RepID=A0A372G4X7_9ACTN|nr:hypothetical protein [Micromonospora craniellae]QOC93052.1 hypothetical protein ID554_04895 [Micromonospora craniellae]RFS47829.1 hypothetical protein D0Q02_04670 [Micromonospora craniellae]